MKRTLSIVLSLLMVLSCCTTIFGLFASAEESGKYQIKTMLGYAGGDVTIVTRLTSGESTLDEILYKFKNDKHRDWNGYAIIVVNKDNVVTAIDTNVYTDPNGNYYAKGDVVVPEGGYIIGVNGENKGNADIWGVFSEVAVGYAIKLYNVDLAAVAAVTGVGTELSNASYDVVKAEYDEVPEGAAGITNFATYGTDVVSIFFRIGEATTVSEIVAAAGGRAGTFAWSNGIVVDASNKIIQSLNAGQNEDKSNVVVPEGGYVITAHNGGSDTNPTPGYVASALIGSASVGDFVTLYNVDKNITASRALVKAAFTIGEDPDKVYPATYGKSYTVAASNGAASFWTGAGGACADDGIRLTDGKAGSLAGDTAVYTAFAGLAGETDGDKDHGIITVDLGEVTSLDKFDAYTASQGDWGIGAPYWMNVSVSTDGENYTVVGYTGDKETFAGTGSGWTSYVHTIELEEAVEARYVRFRIWNGGSFLWVSEVEAWTAEPVAYDDSLFTGDEWTNAEWTKIDGVTTGSWQGGLKGDQSYEFVADKDDKNITVALKYNGTIMTTAGTVSVGGNGANGNATMFRTLYHDPAAERTAFTTLIDIAYDGKEFVLDRLGDFINANGNLTAAEIEAFGATFKQARTAADSFEILLTVPVAKVSKSGDVELVLECSYSGETTEEYGETIEAKTTNLCLYHHGYGEDGKFKVTYSPWASDYAITFVTEEPVPADAIVIEFAGYRHAAAVSILAGDNQTVAELTARGNNGTAKDLNYAYNILVDKDNKVIATDYALSVPCTFVCPEGGYIITYNGNKAGYAVMADIKVGDEIKLYNINLDKVRTLEGYEALANGAFTYTPHEHDFQAKTHGSFKFEECSICGEPGKITDLEGNEALDLHVSHNNNYSWGVFDVNIISKPGTKATDINTNNAFLYGHVYVVETVDGEYTVTKYFKPGSAENNTVECPENGFLMAAWSGNQDQNTFNSFVDGALLGYKLYPDFDLSVNLAIDTTKAPAVHMYAVPAPVVYDDSLFTGDEWTNAEWTKIDGVTTGSWQGGLKGDQSYEFVAKKEGDTITVALKYNGTIMTTAGTVSVGGNNANGNATMFRTLYHDPAAERTAFTTLIDIAYDGEKFVLDRLGDFINASGNLSVDDIAAFGATFEQARTAEDSFEILLTVPVAKVSKSGDVEMILECSYKGDSTEEYGETIEAKTSNLCLYHHGYGEDGKYQASFNPWVSDNAVKFVTEEPEAGEYVIKTFAGYVPGDVSILVRQEGKTTIETITNARDYNAYALIIVDKDGKVIDIDLRGPGRPAGVKGDVEVPEGGFIIGINRDTAGYPIELQNETFVATGVKVGDTVKLYGVDLAALATTAAETNLTGASFDIESAPEVPVVTATIEKKLAWAVDCFTIVPWTLGDRVQSVVNGTYDYWRVAIVSWDAENEVYTVTETYLDNSKKEKLSIPEYGFAILGHVESAPAMAFVPELSVGDKLYVYDKDLSAVETPDDVIGAVIATGKLDGKDAYAPVEAYNATVKVNDNAILTDGNTDFSGGWGTVGANDVLLVANTKATEAPMVVTIIDELDATKKLDSVVLDLYHDGLSMIGYPEGKAVVFVSDDGEAWTYVNAFALAEAELSLTTNGTVSTKIDLGGVEAKFVKIVLKVGSSTAVLGDSPAGGKVFWEFISIAEVGVNEVASDVDPLEGKYEGEYTIVLPETKDLSYGDVDGNGTINAVDYIMVKRAILGSFTLTDEQKELADVNHDGKIDTVDYIMVKRAILGSITITVPSETRTETLELKADGTGTLTVKVKGKDDATCSVTVTGTKGDDGKVTYTVAIAEGVSYTVTVNEDKTLSVTIDGVEEAVTFKPVTEA